MNIYPFYFSFMVQFMTLIISRVTSYIRMLNKMEMLRNESVKYQLILLRMLGFAWSGSGNLKQVMYWQVWEWEHYQSEMFLLSQRAW